MKKNGYRFEFKYLVSREVARCVENEIKRFGMFNDRYATEKDGSYVVSSLYFDSFDLIDYLEKTSGNVRRKKIRMRIYEPFLENSEFVFFEIKHKVDMMNRKTKIRLKREEAECFMQEGESFLLRKEYLGPEESIKKNILLYYLIKKPVRPTAVVTYSRKAYMDIPKSVRITFDYNLRASMQRHFRRSQFMVPVNKDGYIIEVKFGHVLPFWFKSIINKYNLQRDTFSKYERSLEEIYKYNPLLR